jgi:hypothetical protein
MYNDIVLDHFSAPRNVGELADADGIGKVGNPRDGDTVIFILKLIITFLPRCDLRLLDAGRLSLPAVW